MFFKKEARKPAAAACASLRQTQDVLRNGIKNLKARINTSKNDPFLKKISGIPAYSKVINKDIKDLEHTIKALQTLGDALMRTLSEQLVRWTPLQRSL